MKSSQTRYGNASRQVLQSVANISFYSLTTKDNMVCSGFHPNKTRFSAFPFILGLLFNLLTLFLWNLFLSTQHPASAIRIRHISTPFKSSCGFCSFCSCVSLPNEHPAHNCTMHFIFLNWMCPSSSLSAVT